MNDPSTPSSLRRAWRSARTLSCARPGFLVIGGQKCGTTSLYHYLTQHPCVAAASKKEIQYFSENLERGEGWYRSHFPRLVGRDPGRLLGRGRILTGEATPYYLFHPHAPKRVRESLPGVKLLVMLRNPVERAFSHHRYHSKLGYETLSFEEAVAAEPSRLEGELDRLQRDEHYEAIAYKHYSYLARGRYVDQLERWFAQFPREQFLILSSEQFFRDPSGAYREVLEFLQLPPHELPSYDAVNVGSYAPIDAATRARLVDHFREPNRRLYELLDRDFGWD
jgi:hypothetical protein